MPSYIEQEINVFQKLHAVILVYNSLVRHNVAAQGRRNAHHHHVVRVVVFAVTKRLSYGVTASFNDIWEMVTEKHDFIHRRVCVLVQIVVEV